LVIFFLLTGAKYYWKPLAKGGGLFSKESIREVQENFEKIYKKLQAIETGHKLA